MCFFLSKTIVCQSRLRARLKIFQLIFSVGLFPLLCQAEGQFTAEELVSRSFPGKVGHIIVEMFNGNIQIAANRDHTISLDVTKRGSGSSPEEARQDLKNIEVVINMEKKVLRVIGRRTREQNHALNSGTSAKLSIPADTMLDLVTSNGGITSVGPVGKLSADTTNGNIEIHAAQGTLKCKTSNGAILIRGGMGKISAETSNEGIDIIADNAEIIAHTNNGPITFKGILKPAKHVFYTENGKINISLPGKTIFNVDAETANGSIASDFLISEKESGEGLLKGSAGVNPKISLHLRTSNESIELRKIR